jgi:cellulose synthase/poly-beta-1,6-N-acetylglucosamine synthase-like glycosyltransferase
MSTGDMVMMTIAVLVAIPFVVLAIEALASLLPVRRWSVAGARRACAVLIPAHDEEVGVAAAIRNVQDQITPGDRIIVIADNCTDGTAAIARSTGVEVIERCDPDRRGKGYALDFGLNYLAPTPPPIVAVVDADCELGPGALDALVRQAAATDRPTQGVYLIGTGREGDPRRRLSAFAVLLKNKIRPLGLDRLGLSCLLTGTGMAFPWRVIRSVNIGTGNIVEDTRLGVDLALAGYPPQLCPAATLSGAAAPDRPATIKQRSRWEHGHVQTLITQTPRLVLSGLIRARPRVVGLGLELAIPPLSLLLVCWMFVFLACLFWWQLAGASWAPVVTVGGAALLAGMAIFLSWVRYGRTMLPFRTLVTAPAYVAWKLPIYLRLVTAREKTWVRTDRGRS